MAPSSQQPPTIAVALGVSCSSWLVCCVQRRRPVLHQRPTLTVVFVVVAVVGDFGRWNCGVPDPSACQRARLKDNLPSAEDNEHQREREEAHEDREHVSDVARLRDGRGADGHLVPRRSIALELAVVKTMRRPSDVRSNGGPALA